MTAYYNEIDPYAAQWLRNLIAAGHIAPGDVDERSIEDVKPSDLGGFTQCHFFAGIGVWSLALRRAGWPDDRPVWTGSCPCQPFSSAGAQGGLDDERHLWPHFHWLVEQCRPPAILGEQVASKSAEAWVDLVQLDLEALEYAYGAVPFPSAGVGAPHIRDRLFWVADADSRTGDKGGSDLRGRADGGNAKPWPGPSGGRMPGRMADAYGGHSGAEREQRSGQQRQQPKDGSAMRLAYASGAGLDQREWVTEVSSGTTGTDPRQAVIGDGLCNATRSGPVNGFWADADWLLCRDGKWRPVEPGTFPLVDGSAGRVGRVRADQERLAALVPRKDQGSRVGRLRGYGNAINAEAARVFIETVMECMP